MQRESSIVRPPSAHIPSRREGQGPKNSKRAFCKGRTTQPYTMFVMITIKTRKP